MGPRYLGAFALKAKATAGLIYLLDLPKHGLASPATPKTSAPTPPAPSNTPN
ncbi:hypothetical protein COO91_09260 (plasmid) [Nostoc flagelliforme CCNUN1]|uniref:Uncharacterized protein n=1 Tax=Nostoc flagelliforme CCNUN1 TaxID=2038116 RepID=A0A2K8T5X5_9NOSO|nr:hypothetical protein COO91_09260 [Nostoc flagelliforme CCNUN1]